MEKERYVNNGRTLVLEDSSLKELKKRMFEKIQKGFKLKPKYGYTVDENVTKYENTVTGIRFQGVLEK